MPNPNSVKREKDGVDHAPTIDDLLLQEIYSQREQLKIVMKILSYFDPDMVESMFLHSIGHCDYAEYRDDWTSGECGQHEAIRQMRAELQVFIDAHPGTWQTDIADRPAKFYVWTDTGGSHFADDRRDIGEFGANCGRCIHVMSYEEWKTEQEG